MGADRFNNAIQTDFLTLCFIWRRSPEPEPGNRIYNLYNSGFLTFIAYMATRKESCKSSRIQVIFVLRYLISNFIPLTNR